MKKTNNYFNSSENAYIYAEVRKITNYSNIAFERLQDSGHSYSKTYIIYVANGNSKSTIEPILKVFSDMVKENKETIAEIRETFEV